MLLQAQYSRVLEGRIASKVKLGARERRMEMIADPRILIVGIDNSMHLLQQGLRIVLYGTALCLTSARVQHVAQRTFLRSRDADRELGLDSNPASGVSTVEACQRRLPGIGRRIALRTIDTRSHCPKLGRIQVIGKFPATSLGPGVCTGLAELAKAPILLG